MLSDLAVAARKSGLKVVAVPGWVTRTRPASTGTFAPRGILCHHTGDATDGLGYAVWLARDGRADLPAPLCQLSLGRDGTVYVIAAGRANHAGQAKASGPMPAGDGNTLYIGIEAQNTGSEGWTDTQRDAYVRLCAALCEHYGWPATHVRGHKETSVTGKWDPGAIDMSTFRNDVAAAMAVRTLEDDMPLTDADVQKVAAAAAKALLNYEIDDRDASGHVTGKTTVRHQLERIETFLQRADDAPKA